MQLSEHGDGYFSNIIAPCTLDQVMDMVFVLSEIQRHPFIQVISIKNWVIPLRDLFLYRNVLFDRRWFVKHAWVHWPCVALAWTTKAAL